MATTTDNERTRNERTEQGFTQQQLDYLASQRLGRLATVDAGGRPQNNPVGFSVQDDGTIAIGGYDLAATRKFRNVRANGYAALVVDDLASVDPWHVRGVEIRGRAEALTDVVPTRGRMSRAQIRIHPDWIHSWGLGDRGEGS
jgi:pyridoxamine 5'-phosphate oxidase family protein